MGVDKAGLRQDRRGRRQETKQRITGSKIREKTENDHDFQTGPCL